MSKQNKNPNQTANHKGANGTSHQQHERHQPNQDEREAPDQNKHESAQDRIQNRLDQIRLKNESFKGTLLKGHSGDSLLGTTAFRATTNWSIIRLAFGEFFWLLADLLGGAIFGLACYKIFFTNHEAAALPLASIGLTGGLYSYIKRAITRSEGAQSTRNKRNKRNNKI